MSIRWSVRARCFATHLRCRHSYRLGHNRGYQSWSHDERRMLLFWMTIDYSMNQDECVLVSTCERPLSPKEHGGTQHFVWFTTIRSFAVSFLIGERSRPFCSLGVYEVALKINVKYTIFLPAASGIDAATTRSISTANTMHTSLKHVDVQHKIWFSCDAYQGMTKWLPTNAFFWTHQNPVLF